MSPQFIRELYDYTFWADRKVWECIEQLSEEQLREQSGFALGTLRDQALHEMGVQYWWVHFLATGELDFIEPDEYPSRESMRDRWDEIEREVRVYLERLTEKELDRKVRPEFWEPEEGPITVWQALFQVANHSTDHRAQMLSVIHHLGGETVGQDYLNYLHERQMVKAGR